MDDPSYSQQMASLGCMLQSLADQFAAYQRDHPAALPHPPTPQRSAGASGALLTEVLMLVRRLQADLHDLRAELRAEIHTEVQVRAASFGREAPSVGAGVDDRSVPVRDLVAMPSPTALRPRQVIDGSELAEDVA